MKRREFIRQTSYGVGAAWLGVKGFAASGFALPRKFSASDTVTIGKTGITTSRLAWAPARWEVVIIRIRPL
jgi:hypothetical protein